MTALTELLDGEVGVEFVQLLKRTILSVAISRNFPSPSGKAFWTADDLQETAHAFIADPQTSRRFADLALHCATDRALAHRLQGSIRNFLRDQGRATEIGRLIRRVRRALREDDQFIETADGLWTLVGGDKNPTTIPFAELEKAASMEKEVAKPEWGPEARRRAPVADRESIVRLIQRVLKAASGACRAEDISKAIAPRLSVSPQPVTLEVDAGDRPEPVHPSTLFDATADEVIENMVASEIFGMLTDRERLALAYHEIGVRDLGPKIGTSHSQAHVIRRRAIEILRFELVGEENGEVIARAVVGLAMDWAADRTQRADLT
jgi:hypothetical protein